MDQILIYRIIHYSNLEYILSTGLLTCANNAEFDKGYKSIGNNNIIVKRNLRALPFDKRRTFQDYIPFYFGPRSIMLYNIKTGYGEVELLPQDEIIYMTYDIANIGDREYFFTDGHALQYPITQFYTSLNDMANVDFNAVHAKDFSSDAVLKNPGLKRRKQSEFHIYDSLNANELHDIAVYSNDRCNQVKDLLEKYDCELNVRVDRTYYFT